MFTLLRPTLRKDVIPVAAQIISIHDMLNTTTNYLTIIEMATEESQ